MARRKLRIKPSYLVQPDPMVDKKYADQDQNRIQAEIAKCKNGLEGLKYFVNEYIYVQNKIKPEILKEKPSWFQHLHFEKEKINLKLYPKQEEYLEYLWKNRLVASYKSRQCLPIGSVIFTPNGPVEIQDLKPNDLVYSFNEETGETEIDVVVDAQCSGIRQCNIMRTLDGNRTEQGENHPFLLQNGQWKRSSELENGDVLVSNEGIFGDIRVPDYEAKLLGQFITDGRTVKQPSFTNTNWDYIVDVSNCINRYDPDLTVTIRERDKSNDDQLDSWDVYPHLDHGSNKKNSFHEFLIRMGIYGHSGKTKILPMEVFEWDKSSISLLINRIFAGDGWFTKSKSGRNNGCEVGLGSPCRQFIYQIKQLLWNFGINSKVKKSYEKGSSGDPFYRLIICHRANIKRFYDEIGIFGKPLDYIYAHNTKSPLKKVISNKNTNVVTCYDIETFKNKNFIFEGHVVHNTGISTITQAFVLQYALFNDNKEIVIISKAEAEAIKFLDVIYYMFNHLPFFLRRQYSKAVKKSFHLGSLNKATKINVLTSTSKSGRSFSATILILDEAEFIDHADDLWAAAQPTLSATGGQAIIISTPWRYKSWFWKICHGEGGDGAAFKKFKINWSDIPGRDQEWYEAQCAELNHDRLKIQTELDMQWIIDAQKYYQEETLKAVGKHIIKPSDFHRWKEEYGIGIILPPKDGIEYYFGVDTYEGGLDHNAGIVIGGDMRPYAYFKTQRLDIFDVVKFLCDLYNTKLCLERNRSFWLIKDFMDKELHKKYLLYRLVKRKNIYDEQWGFITNGDNRKKLITSTSEYLKYVYNWNQSTENDFIRIPEDLWDEMNYFVIKKARVEGLEHDDLIFALIAALYVRDNKSTFYNWKTGPNKSNMTGLVNQFYGMVNEASGTSLLANGKVNTIIARNFLGGIGKGTKMTVDQLDMLDKVLTFGKLMIDEKNKADSTAEG